MRRVSARLVSVASITLVLLVAFSGISARSARATLGDPPLAVGVWSSSCGASNITITNCGSGSLAVGNTINVQINATNAQIGSVNGFEFYLFYDPAYINATGYDASGSILSGGSGISVAKSEFKPAGTVHLAAVCLACSNTSDNGPLISIVFKILAIGVSPIALAAGLVSHGQASSFTVLTSTSGGSLIPVTSDGYFKNEPVKLGPVAKFTFSPNPAKQFQQIVFDASASSDADNSSALNKGIVAYEWDFGGASSLSASVASPTYTIRLGSTSGNFSVRLTVVDSDNRFEGIQTQQLTIVIPPFHDLIAGVTISPRTVNPGDKVTVSASVKDNGTFTELFDLSVSSSMGVVGSETSQSVLVSTTRTYPFTLDTTGWAPGVYEITANVTILSSQDNPGAIENIPLNNQAAAFLTVQGPQGSSDLLLIVGGVVAAVVVLSVVGLVMRRRRRPSDA